MRNLIILGYSVFILVFIIFSYLFVDENLIYLRFLYTNFNHLSRELTSILYIISVVVFFCFYTLFLYLFRKKILSSRDIKILFIISCLLIFSYPAMLSYDIFNYIATAKVFFYDKENPYIIMPNEFINDPLLLFMHAPNKTALYGPVWLLLSFLPFFFGFGSFLLTLLTFKLFILVFFIGTVYIIQKLTVDKYSVLLFALNPLVLIETLVSGHNDIVMVFLFLVSFYFLKQKKLFISLIFLLLSILIKYASIILIPVFLLVIYKTYINKKIAWESIYMFSFILMFMMFLFSFLREEIYPWYALWFFIFICLIPKKKYFLYISLVMTFGLLLRHVPFMLLGTHFGTTPIIKKIVTFLPPMLVVIVLFIQNLRLKQR